MFLECAHETNEQHKFPLNVQVKLHMVHISAMLLNGAICKTD